VFGQVRVVGHINIGLKSMAVLDHVPINKTGKCEHNKQCPGYGVKLPTLWRNLTSSVFEYQANAASYKVQQYQFGKAQSQWLESAPEGKDPN